MNLNKLIDMPYMDQKEFSIIFQKAKDRGGFRSEEKGSFGATLLEIIQEGSFSYFLIAIVLEKSAFLADKNLSSDEIFTKIQENIEDEENNILNKFWRVPADSKEKLNESFDFFSARDIFVSYPIRKKLDFLLNGDNSKYVSEYLADRNIIKLIKILDKAKNEYR